MFRPPGLTSPAMTEFLRQGVIWCFAHVDALRQLHVAAGVHTKWCSRMLWGHAGGASRHTGTHTGRLVMFSAWAICARKRRAGRCTGTLACCLLAWGGMHLLKLGLQHVRVWPGCGPDAPTLDISCRSPHPYEQPAMNCIALIKPLHFVQRSPLLCMDATCTTETSQGVAESTPHYPTLPAGSTLGPALRTCCHQSLPMHSTRMRCCGWCMLAAKSCWLAVSTISLPKHAKCPCKTQRQETGGKDYDLRQTQAQDGVARQSSLEVLWVAG